MGPVNVFSFIQLSNFRVSDILLFFVTFLWPIEKTVMWYLEKKFCICYNGSRQKDIAIPCNVENENPRGRISGVFYSHFMYGRV